jgi:hypothetical protein
LVTDFENGLDTFDLRGVAGVHDRGDLYPTDRGADVLVDYGTASFLVENVAGTSLFDAGDFVFVCPIAWSRMAFSVEKNHAAAARRRTIIESRACLLLSLLRRRTAGTAPMDARKARRHVLSQWCFAALPAGG